MNRNDEPKPFVGFNQLVCWFVWYNGKVATFDTWQDAITAALNAPTNPAWRRHSEVKAHV